MIGSVASGTARSIDDIKAVLNALPAGADGPAIRSIDAAIGSVAPDLQAIMQREFDDLVRQHGSSVVGIGTASNVARDVLGRLDDVANPSVARWVDRMVDHQGSSTVSRATSLIDTGPPRSSLPADVIATQQFRAAELLRRLDDTPPASWVVSELRGARGAFDDASEAVRSIAARHDDGDFAARLVDPDFLEAARRYVGTAKELPDGWSRDSTERAIRALTDVVSS